VSPFNGSTKLTTPYLDQTTFPGTPSDARSLGREMAVALFTLQTIWLHRAIIAPDGIFGSDTYIFHPLNEICPIHPHPQCGEEGG